jgi:hypothetical protein
MGLPLHLFDWQPSMDRAGIKRDALYLIRPDGYVGVADPLGAVKPLTEYVAKHGIAGASEALAGRRS